MIIEYIERHPWNDNAKTEDDAAQNYKTSIDFSHHESRMRFLTDSFPVY